MVIFIFIICLARYPYIYLTRRRYTKKYSVNMRGIYSYNTIKSSRYKFNNIEFDLLSHTNFTNTLCWKEASDKWPSTTVQYFIFWIIQNASCQRKCCHLLIYHGSSLSLTKVRFWLYFQHVVTWLNMRTFVGILFSFYSCSRMYRINRMTFDWCINIP